ncbi:hypothetical protein GWI33_016922, partial [Rhynchophorus ferrugineus]
FSNLLSSESLVDVTLAAEGKHLQAHKVVLSACSSYFQSLFTINPCQHPIVILKDVKFIDLKIMVDFMYYGEVNVSQEQLPCILKTAEMLKIKGLAEFPMEQTLNKAHNSNLDKTELLTAQDSNWSSDGMPLQSSTPSPCSPGTRRKRLRKTSSGSGSGERPDDLRQNIDTQQQNDLMLGQNMSILGSVIKSDPGGYASDTGTLAQKNRDSSDLQRGNSHESVENDTLHQITLQVPQHKQQEINLQHNLESQPGPDVPGSSASSQPQPISGLQWNVMDQNYYPCSTEIPLQNGHGPSTQQVCANSATGQTESQSAGEAACFQGQIGSSPPQIIQKRKRSVNPQGDENFIRALEAVRFGGIGFCKAARMYGVNNRTLWLEYKKRGYPNFRLSIKNRKQENQNPPPPANTEQSPPPNQVTQPEPPFPKQEQVFASKPSDVPPDSIICTTTSHPVALISGTFFDGKHVDLGPVLHRPKYFDPAAINIPHAMSFQNLNFEQM